MPQIIRSIDALFDDRFVRWRFDNSFKPEDIKGPFFLADSPAILKQKVAYDKPHTSVGILDIDLSRDPYLGFYDRDGLNWRFLYYDPDYTLKKAWIEGKEIQFNNHGYWTTASTPCWGEYEFRLAPEEEKPTVYKETVPFDNVQEMLDFYRRKHLQGASLPTVELPHIWIKQNEGACCNLLVTGYRELTVLVGNNDIYSMKELFEHFTFLDGSPIGKEVVRNAA